MTKAPYNRDLLTAALGGFTAGYTTSNTKVRFNTFGGMMTGNTVKVGIALQQKNWEWAGVYFACISLFAVGTVFAIFMLQKLGQKVQKPFLLVFVASFLLVDGMALALEDYDPVYTSLVSSLAAFALGAQNLLSQKSGIVKANTTFMTGNIQKMAEAGWNQYTKKGGLKPAEQRAAFLLFLTWSFYIVGGVCGAALAERFKWSLTPAGVIYGIGMASMLTEAPKPPKADAAKTSTTSAGPPPGNVPAVAPASEIVKPAAEVVIDVAAPKAETSS